MNVLNFPPVADRRQLAPGDKAWICCWKILGSRAKGVSTGAEKREWEGAGRCRVVSLEPDGAITVELITAAPPSLLARKTRTVRRSDLYACASRVEHEAFGRLIHFISTGEGYDGAPDDEVEEEDGLAGPPATNAECSVCRTPIAATKPDACPRCGFRRHKATAPQLALPLHQGA